jgi:hypothetical protein
MRSHSVSAKWTADGGECRRKEGRKDDDEPTKRGNQFDQSAQDRMIIKNPTARTNESKITAGGGKGVRVCERSSHRLARKA